MGLSTIAMGALAVAVRVPDALHYALWQDEVFSARAIGEASPIGVLRHVARAESTPPLWYLLMWAPRRLGASVDVLRLYSVACGGATAALVVVYARRLVPLWSAALAGLLLAVGWQPLTHGSELRAYEMLALASLAFAMALERACSSATRANLVLLGSVEAAGSLTHYFFLTTVAAGIVWLPTAGLERRTVRRIVVTLAVGLVPLLMWSPAFVHQYRAHRFGFIGPFAARDVVELYARLFARALPHGVLGSVTAAVAAAIVLAGAWRVQGLSGRGRLCALATVVPVVFTAAAWLAGAHVFVARNLLGVAPFAAIAGSAALAALPRATAVAATACAGALMIVGFLHSRQPPPAYDKVAATLVSEGWTTSSPIVLFGDLYGYLHPLDWYLPGAPGLATATPTGRSCPSLFVVSVGGAGRALTRGATRVARIRSVLVARIPWRPDVWTATASRGGYVLGASTPPVSPCARVSGRTAA